MGSMGGSGYSATMLAALAMFCLANGRKLPCSGDADNKPFYDQPRTGSCARSNVCIFGY